MKFSYRAKTTDGVITKDVLEANSEKEAVKILSEQKLFVLDITEDKAQNIAGLELNFLSSVSLKDKIVFTKELAMMIKGGLPLVDALESLQEQTENKNLSRATKDIANDVKGGMALSKALAKHSNIFQKLYIAIVSSGEQSGKLDEVLEKLAEQLQKDYDLIAKVKSAISYPLVIVVALVGIMVLMMIFVVPKLKDIFTDMGAELPLITRIILGISDWLVKFWYIALLIIVALIIGFYLAGKNAKTAYSLDRVKVRLPIFGELIKKIYFARFARTMGTLVGAGLPILNSLATVKEVVNSPYLADYFDRISAEVESGVALSTSMRKQKVFPAMICQMLAMGEKSGRIDNVLFDLADFYDKEVTNTTANLASLIEPILILVVGAGVGLAVASVIMPIYSLVNVI